MVHRSRLALGAAVALIVLSAWWYAFRRGTVVAAVPDGAFVTFPCPASEVRVVSARYAPPGRAPSSSAAAALRQQLVTAGAATMLVFHAASAGLPPGGVLTARFRFPAQRTSRSGFWPVPISVCGAVYDDHYAVDMGNRAGTIVWDPYSSISRISLGDRGAL